jgi:hypothetical protein
MTKSIDKIKIIKAVVSKIMEETNPEKIEAKDLGNFDTPESIPINSKDRFLIPDLAVHYAKELNIYEIELDDKLNPFKWKMMSKYTKQMKGHLFLVVPDFMKDKVREELEKIGVNAGLLYFTT